MTDPVGTMADTPASPAAPVSSPAEPVTASVSTAPTAPQPVQEAGADMQTANEMPTEEVSDSGSVPPQAPTV